MMSPFSVNNRRYYITVILFFNEEKLGIFLPFGIQSGKYIKKVKGLLHILQDFQSVFYRFSLPHIRKAILLI